MPQVDNGAGIGDNSAKISDDTAGIVDIATKVKSDPMLNSIMNGDWSNSVPGRQITKWFLQVFQNV